MSRPIFRGFFSQVGGRVAKRYQQYLMLDHAQITCCAIALPAGTTAQNEPGDPACPFGCLQRINCSCDGKAMTPVLFARKGEGACEYSWGWFDSPFGPALVMGTPRGICGLAFFGEMGTDAAMEIVPPLAGARFLRRFRNCCGTGS